MATLARMEAPQTLSEEDARTLMRKMAQKFNFQPAIADWLVEQGVRSLTDFQDLVTTKEAIGTEVTDKMPKNTQWTGSKMVQTARVRTAWTSIFEAAASEKSQSELAETGQEALLAPELKGKGLLKALIKARNLEQHWWMRNATPDAGECPSNYVVTTSARQLLGRRITQPNMLQEKTLKTQKGPNTKRETVNETAGGQGLELVDREAMDEVMLGPRKDGHLPREDNSPEDDTEGRRTNLADQMRNGERI